MLLTTPPTLRHVPTHLDMKDMPPLNLEPIRTDVILSHAKLPDDPEPIQPGLLARFTQRRILRRLPSPHAPGRNLDTNLLEAHIHMPEHQ